MTGGSQTTREPPDRLLRLVFRLPRLLYRARLGWLLGNRFVLIHHLGRRTGTPRATVVEVISHDRGTGEIIIAAGYGKRSDWYRNVLHHPQTTAQLNTRELAVTATAIPPGESMQLLGTYAAAHPRAARMLARVLGFGGDVSQLAGKVPLIRLSPRSG